MIYPRKSMSTKHTYALLKKQNCITKSYILTFLLNKSFPNPPNH